VTFAATDEHWMRRALALAKEGEAHGEVPVGAVLVLDGLSIGEGFNQPISACDPTAHAEILALRQAAAHQHNYRLPGSTLYVTLEPCTMCIGALIHARVGHLVFGAAEPRAGAVCSRFHLLDVDNVYNHRITYNQGLLASASSELLTDFFRSRRKATQQT
jgi:tRNA(adenine34) deaminase